MFGLLRKNKAMLGIDISATAVKLIELSQGSGSPTDLYRVESFAVEPLPTNAVVEQRIADPEAVGQCIQRAVQRCGTKTKRAAVAVSGSAVITKVISMSAGLTDAEMENQIQLEADQYIPYPLEEVNIDFDVLGTSQTSPDMVDVLLAASRRENVDDHVSALEVAGLTAGVVDVEAYAMENACSLILGGHGEAVTARTVAVADVGSATTTLHVLHEGQVVYTREQNFGGQQLIDEVQRRYSLPRDLAAQKVVEGDVAEDYDAEVLGPFKEALAQQIGRALQFFYSGSTFNRVDQLILAGGTASIVKIDELVEDRLELPTTAANPFAQMSFSPRVDAKELLRNASGMMVAVGLALRGFD
ncbi:pilus assembly protein PilM [uncultured Thiodictyon sp.]|uniref:pilus assembly protein PilM n=1 Tax=uncultured Thiodictyon sp. TaxID=1846217 RepID=UPI0025E9FE1C|nr:pilus assembly protein PilM [uncultured Thiodictyon sp.]